MLSSAIWMLGTLLAAAVAPASGQAPARMITVVAGGALLFDRGVRSRMEKVGIGSLLANLRAPLNRADLALANLECPLTKLVAPRPKRYVFRCDPEVAVALRGVGFHALSLANNHSIDQGRDGLLDTMAALEGAGIVPLGAGRTQREAQRHQLLTVQGMRVALLAYVALIIEGVVFLEDEPAAAQLQGETVVAQIAAARAQADMVVVTIHWGTEFRSHPSEEQRRLGHLFIDAGAELVLGHHPHVLQPVERYHDGVIAYSLGNLVFDQRRQDGRETALLRCRLGPHRVADCQAYPLEIKQERPQPASAEARHRIQAILQVPLAE
jgi:poly-gamma-glutamate capsule biosynthesis protein CapA/YwtB (metallophosphatase superfamily)